MSGTEEESIDRNNNVSNWIYLLAALLLFAFLFFCFVIAKYHRTIIAILSTMPRDLQALIKFHRWKFATYMQRKNNETVGSMFSSLTRKHPGKVAFYFENGKWTFDQIEKMSNRVGNYFFCQGLRKGDTAAFFSENSPEFIFIFLGLSKIGVKISFINTNLRLQPLKHSLEYVPIKSIIFSSDLASAVEGVTIIGGLLGVLMFVLGQIESDTYPSLQKSIDLNKVLKDSSCSSPPESEAPAYSDDLCYILTSGTTALPKPVLMKQSKFISLAAHGRIFNCISSTDIIYVSVPMYHCFGLMAGAGQLLISGYTVVIRRKFSAKSYFSDCCRYNATVAVYIGEICRNLLAMPPSPSDTQHKVHLAYGSGLRKEIWQLFTKRFNIPKISETYASTEGNFILINVDNKIGAVGCSRGYIPEVYPLCLVRVDEDTGDIVRHPTTGIAFKCRVGETGELIGKIIHNIPTRSFDGYADQSLTKGKILRDIITKGDMWFRTGDLLEMDIYGCFYFKDRAEDFYRWRGEDVSTFEAESVISAMCSLMDVAVYGVQVTCCEGKAGMAAIADPKFTLNLQKLSESLTESLPYHAIPIFLRIVSQLDFTGTFKFKKTDLQKEGFDIHGIQDPLYFWRDGNYVPLTEELYNEIVFGNMSVEIMSYF